MKNLIILISKGRNLKKILIYLKFYNIYIKENLFFTRKIFYSTNLKYLYIIIIKNLDINFYLKNNIADYFFFGKDLFYENEINIFYKFYNLYFLKFNLSLITNIDFLKNKLNNIILYTKYINISNNFFNYINFKKISFLKINSSSELILIFKKANFIIDIISSGKTIKENNLYKLCNLMEMNNILLLNLNLLYNKIFIIFLNKFKLLFNVII